MQVVDFQPLLTPVHASATLLKQYLQHLVQHLAFFNQGGASSQNCTVPHRPKYIPALLLLDLKLIPVVGLSCHFDIFLWSL